jgi:hypothetical protein
MLRLLACTDAHRLDLGQPGVAHTLGDRLHLRASDDEQPTRIFQMTSMN